MLDLLSEMSMLLIKQSIQNIDFCKHSPSVVVIASFYAATAFLKHSKKHEGSQTTSFCTDVRKLIFQILFQEAQTNKTDKFREKQYLNKLRSISSNPDLLIQNYLSQFSQENIEQIAMNLVDFFKIFNEWHCGLN